MTLNLHSLLLFEWFHIIHEMSLIITQQNSTVKCAVVDQKEMTTLKVNFFFSGQLATSSLGLVAKGLF